MKYFVAHVQFDAIEVRVKAKNITEVKMKIKEKVAKMNTLKLLDKRNFFVDGA